MLAEEWEPGREGPEERCHGGQLGTRHSYQKGYRDIAFGFSNVVATGNPDRSGVSRRVEA